MIDVRLLYPPEKLEAAARLAESIEAAGYSVERQALAGSGAFPDLSAHSGEAGVLLLIWSRGLVTAAMSGGLADARRRSNLIEVSIDGIEPAFGGENSPVVLLSGWRGQPFHLGWQRILADIKRLSRPREASRKSGSAPPADAARRSPAVGIGRLASRRTSIRAAVAAGTLLAATLGAAAVLDWSGSGAPPNAGARPATASGNPPPAESTPAQRGAGTRMPVQAALPTPAPDSPAAPPASPMPIGNAARTPGSEGLAARLDSAGAASAREPAAGRSRPLAKVAAQRSGSKRLALAAQPGVKRYSRKYSKTMRLFCQRSGRSTHQCRTFARSMRDRRD